ncbi:MAG TPA: hypothetical protein VK083_09520 [Nocardia sp.]|uniref:hypothetical protein n=1 Tax=Nocardia sp. TaxID=1821 RepID=UPI002B4B17C1|nr:hypothetical protein [Nocardia sp.]HLS77014.1 hypothetical protein [Nocardia sp.]
MTTIRTRWVIPVASVMVTGTASACAASGPPPTAIALVDADTGPTGARVADSLRRDGGGYDWRFVTAEEAAAGTYAAVITLPGDLTDSVGSLAGPRPRRAEVSVLTGDRADRQLVDGATTLLTRRISATGVDAALDAAAQARTRLGGVRFTTQLLGASVDAAAAGAAEFEAGAQQMIDLLGKAEAGAGELTASVEALDAAVATAAERAGQLADALDATGLTVAGIEESARTVGARLDAVAPALRALPFADDPALAGIIAELDQLRALSEPLAGLPADLGELADVPVTADTGLGDLLRALARRLGEASAQLTEAAEMAAGLPRLAQEGSAGLIEAVDQLSEGVGRLRTVVGSLDAQTGQALAALPMRGGDQQAAVAAALTDPVEIVRR